MKSNADAILKFINNLNPTFKLPAGVQLLNPFLDKDVLRINREFYGEYYNDNNSRVLIFGINPGRFGAGITGIPFTDPMKAKEVLGLKNCPSGKSELSSDFVYKVIDEFGGTKKFFGNFLISSVCPLGFVKDGRNLNYYDDKRLIKAVLPFIIEQMQEQLKMNVSNEKVICLGEGKNLDFLEELNQEYNFFREILPLPHPRFVMQYKRKEMKQYVGQYLRVLNRTLSTKQA